MGLIAFGLNHQTAALALRECAAFRQDSMLEAHQALVQSGAANEVMILSTCNRTELYTDGHEPARLANWLAGHHQLREEQLSRCLYFHHDQDAVRHALRVASGLDSMVLGEHQILGQMKRSYQFAEQAGTLGMQLGRLFQYVFSVTKDIRTTTSVGDNPVSVAYAAVNLAKQLFSDLSKKTVLCLGAGETVELTAMHFINQGCKHVIIAARNLEKSKELAKKFHGQGILFSDVPLYLKQADIVVSATASQLPVIGKGTIERVLKTRKHRPLFMLDLAVPRDIEPEVASLSDVYLYNIDDLSNVILENLKSRQEAAKQADELIDIQTRHFMRQLQALNANDTICAYRHQVENLATQEYQKALQQIRRGENPELVLQNTLHGLTNKIMHQPTKQLRQAAYDGHPEMLLAARKIFDL